MDSATAATYDLKLNGHRTCSIAKDPRAILSTENLETASNKHEHLSQLQAVRNSAEITQLKKLSDDVDSDDISNIIGHISYWSLSWIFLLSLFQLPTTFHIFMFVFQTAGKQYWCARPNHLSTINVTEWIQFSQTDNGCLILNTDFSHIDYVNNSWLNTSSIASDTNYTQCTTFEFSTEDGGGQTLVQEYKLICNRRHMLNVVEMCFLAGAAIGSVSSGWISDYFGRRHTLMAFASIQSTFGTLLAYSTSLAMFMAIRVIIGFASMTVTIVSFVLVVELVSGKWRTVVGILNILPVAICYILAAGIAYYIRDWRSLQLVISLPWLLLLLFWYWLPESPLWLMARGRLTELYSTLERAAKFNGQTLPNNYKINLASVSPSSIRITEKLDQNNTESTTTIFSHSTDFTNPLIVVFNGEYWKTTCLILIIWLTLIIIYFGLTLHLNNLGGNIYLNTAIVGLAESVSICISIFIVLRLGVRRSLLYYMLIPGICCLLTNLVPQGEYNLFGIIALAMIAKCMIGANNAIIPTFTAMQYPTVVRNFGVGLGNLAAGVALVLVPYLWLLEHFEPLLPMSIMGACGIIGAVALALIKDVKP